MAGKRRDRPVGELRRVLQHLSAGFLLKDGADKWVKRSLLAKEIKTKLAGTEDREERKIGGGQSEDGPPPLEPGAVVLLLPLGRERAVAGRAHQGQCGAALQ